MLLAIAKAEGLTVQTYTSPHLARFHERIYLGDNHISEDFLAKILTECEYYNDSQPITLFEITTAAAFLAFSQKAADLTIIEVGLGGRFDATNIIPPPLLSIITPIDFDHREFLGDTIEAIAREKAGIIKNSTPVIIGPQKIDALNVIKQQAKILSAKTMVFGHDFYISDIENDNFTYSENDCLWTLPRPNLPGDHQIENAAGVITAARCLGYAKNTIAQGLTAANWPARLQRLTMGNLVDNLAKNIELFLDGAHNPHAARALAKTFNNMPVVLIVGLLQTKDAAGFFSAFLEANPPIIAVNIPEHENCINNNEIITIADKANLHAIAAPNIDLAVKMAADMLKNGGRIIICGSLYLAGWVLQSNG